MQKPLYFRLLYAGFFISLPKIHGRVDMIGFLLVIAIFVINPIAGVAAGSIWLCIWAINTFFNGVLGIAQFVAWLRR
jgi:hypothetical protein